MLKYVEDHRTAARPGGTTSTGESSTTSTTCAGSSKHRGDSRLLLADAGSQLSSRLDDMSDQGIIDVVSDLNVGSAHPLGIGRGLHKTFHETHRYGHHTDSPQVQTDCQNIRTHQSTFLAGDVHHRGSRALIVSPT